MHMVQVLLLIVVLFIICQSFKIIPDLYEVYACTVGKNRNTNNRNICVTLKLNTHIFLPLSIKNDLSYGPFFLQTFNYCVGINF